MSYDRHLVAFVKAPLPGRVKSRLAADIGAVAACRFYRHTTRRVLSRLDGARRSHGWRCWLAVTPDAAGPWASVWPQDWERLPQGQGDLGARMARVVAHLPPGPVVIIGTDIPGIGPRHIWQAFRALDAHAAVFGPATDGGYWLVGLRRRPARTGRVPLACGSAGLTLFSPVRWSTEFALSDSIASLRHRDLAMLETLEDVDDGAAYGRWMEREACAGVSSTASRYCSGSVVKASG